MSIGTISESLTYNTYFRKWMLVGSPSATRRTTSRPGIYYALSDDLLELDRRDPPDGGGDHLGPGLHAAGPDQGVRRSSIPNSTSRNFETVGQRAQLFYTLLPPERLQRHARP